MGMSPNQMAQSMQDRFKNADTDESGSVSKEEFVSGAGEDRDSATIEKMFARLDSDGDGEITQVEQDAMLEQMSERADKMAQIKAAGGSSDDMFASLLESLSSDEEEEENSNDLISQLKAQFDNGELTEQDIAQSMMEINKQFPRINTTA